MDPTLGPDGKIVKAAKTAPTTTIDLASYERGIFLQGVLIGQQAIYSKPGRDEKTGRTWPASVTIVSEVAIAEGTVKIREKLDILDERIVVKDGAVLKFPQIPQFEKVRLKVGGYFYNNNAKEIAFNRPEWLAV